MSPEICFQHIIHKSTLRFVSGHDTLHTLCHLFFFLATVRRECDPSSQWEKPENSQESCRGEVEPCAAAAHGEGKWAKTLFTPSFPGKCVPGNQTSLCLWNKNDWQMFCAVQLLSLPGKHWNGVHSSFFMIGMHSWGGEQAQKLREEGKSSFMERQKPSCKNVIPVKVFGLGLGSAHLVPFVLHGGPGLAGR